MDESGALPLGATGRLEAVPMTNASGDHALLQFVDGVLLAR